MAVKNVLLGVFDPDSGEEVRSGDKDLGVRVCVLLDLPSEGSKTGTK